MRRAWNHLEFPWRSIRILRDLLWRLAVLLVLRRARLREIPWFGLPPDDIGPALRKRRGRELHSIAAELTDYGTQYLGMVATAAGHDARMQQKSAKDQSDV
jgi:hypothetical protein